MAGKVLLVEHNKAHERAAEIGFKNLAPRLFYCFFDFSPQSPFTFFMQISRLFTKERKVYSSLTLGTRITDQLPLKRVHSRAKAARNSRFILLRLTAFPCFLETATAILSLSDGKQNKVISGENTFFPLENSF